MRAPYNRTLMLQGWSRVFFVGRGHLEGSQHLIFNNLTVRNYNITQHFQLVAVYLFFVFLQLPYWGPYKVWVQQQNIGGSAPSGLPTIDTHDKTAVIPVVGYFIR